MRSLIFGMFALMLVGCATIEINQPAKLAFEKSRSYSQSFDKTWERAVDWFADHNITIEKIEKPSGLLTAKYYYKADENFLDASNIKVKGVIKDSLVIDRYGTLNLTVRAITDNTTKVNVNFFGRYELKANDQWDGRLITSSGECSSTGKLEKSILDYIDSK